MVPARRSWTREARRLLPKMRAWRAKLHRNPELSGQEVETSRAIAEMLGSLDIPWRTYKGFTGVLATIDPGRKGPVVLLRADMDALPVTEQTGFPFASETPGRMHACGHDVHMASLLGAGALLRDHRARLRGPVKLLFQPSEEDGRRGGALPFIERGCLAHPRVDYAVGQHVTPGIPLGQVGWREGPMMAAADEFRIVVRGRAGHAAMPHSGPDAILAASEIVVGLQALVSRMSDPVDPVVVSVGQIHGGTRHNILPAEVVINGTVRTLRPATRDATERALKRRVTSIAQSLGASARITYHRGYPALENPREATRTVVNALSRELGPKSVVPLRAPVMGAEDFARYLERVPGTFLFLGVDRDGPVHPLHSPEFAPPDEAMMFGAAVLAAAAVGLQEGRP